MPLRTEGERLALAASEAEAPALEDAIGDEEAPGRGRLLEDGGEKQLGNELGEEERLAAKGQGLVASADEASEADA